MTLLSERLVRDRMEMENLIQTMNKHLQSISESLRYLGNENLKLKRELNDIRYLVSTHSKFIDLQFSVECGSKIATESWDHKQPRGTLNDDTRCPQFVVELEKLQASPLVHLDLGCAGGGLVYDFLLQGHYSIGIDGSDVSRKLKRAHWSVIPNHLFTADITSAFSVKRKNGSNAYFNVITAWEVMEHIPEDKLGQLISNICEHLTPDGIFCCSIATFPDFDPVTGAIWHVTLKDKSWWLSRFKQLGLTPLEVDLNPRTFPRGTSNPYAMDNNFLERPDLGFHLVLKKVS
jgi:2-polyprenyl-3-methyl-5-hydroxy-6-metoxy-1,4-benzoquinol methylase